MKVITCTDQIDISNVPEEVKILPIGLVKTVKGDFIVDQESIQLITERFSQRGNDIVIDYEHQTLTGDQAPAAGWIKKIYATDEAIIAKVEWTEAAKNYIKNKEYKYLSPVVICRIKDNVAIEIQSVAVTNTPAIDGMYPMVNSLKNVENKKGDGKKMELDKILKILGLPEGTTEEEALKMLTEAAKLLEKEEKPKEKEEGNDLVGQEKTNTEVVANSTLLSLFGNDDSNNILLELKEVLNFKAEMKEKKANDLVALALSQGKITGNMKDWAKETALIDEKTFMEFLSLAPQVVPLGKTSYGNEPTKEKVEISDSVAMVLKNCNITKEDAEKYVLGHLEKGE